MGLALTALVPGTSRSGATIIRALLMGTKHMWRLNSPFFIIIRHVWNGFTQVSEFGFHYTAAEATYLILEMLIAFEVSLPGHPTSSWVISKKRSGLRLLPRSFRDTVAVLYFLGVFKDPNKKCLEPNKGSRHFNIKLDRIDTDIQAPRSLPRWSWQVHCRHRDQFGDMVTVLVGYRGRECWLRTGVQWICPPLATLEF